MSKNSTNWSPDDKKAFKAQKDLKKTLGKIKEETDFQKIEGYSRTNGKRKTSPFLKFIIILIIIFILIAIFKPEFIENILKGW